MRVEIEKIVPGPFDVIYDAIGLPETQNFAVDLLASGGTLALVLEPAIKAERLGSKERVFQVYGNFNVPANRALGISLFSHLPDLLPDGRIKVSPAACSCHAATTLLTMVSRSPIPLRCFRMDCMAYRTAYGD